MKRFFAPSQLPFNADLALLVLRLIVGIAFVIHGWGKIQSPTGWMGPQATMPSIFLALAAISEFGGGIALILGLLTRLAAIGLIATMAVAVYFHAFTFGDPFVASKQGGGSYELALVYLGISLLLLAIGAGRISLDKLIFGERSNVL
ncbi:DoxX family protein [Mucilaginibacter daejeonensis]|uniref:DoxX family protein n=1 Tax=Mucilaginibacter daejeonensis TaxID=398049 RepID=UPI001D179BC5|nr:DoxX family protein [Mucilaginibacter daejeonensis]UEG55167.1 DoxX family protein [Mucilaginibacter daejeonensis]